MAVFARGGEAQNRFHQQCLYPPDSPKSTSPGIWRAAHVLPFLTLLSKVLLLALAVQKFCVSGEKVIATLPHCRGQMAPQYNSFLDE
jgi:hypothetical protein